MWGNRKVVDMIGRSKRSRELLTAHQAKLLRIGQGAAWLAAAVVVLAWSLQIAGAVPPWLFIMLVVLEGAAGSTILICGALLKRTGSPFTTLSTLKRDCPCRATRKSRIAGA